MTSALSPQSQSFGRRAVVHDIEHDDHDPGTTKVFGFWIYLMSDCLLFASLFATFAVLHRNVAGGPSARELFELPYVAIETALLLFSSITYGFALIGAQSRNTGRVVLWLGVTFLFGLGFVGMEVNEFHHLVEEGNGPDRSAFLSSFFSLVGTHGLHVTAGLVWIAVMVYALLTKGLTPVQRTRLLCLSLFWHFLDIVWICVFTVVYLMGFA